MAVRRRFVVILLISALSNSQLFSPEKLDSKKIYNDWFNCAYPKIEKFKNEPNKLWKTIILPECVHFLRFIEIKEFESEIYKTKYHVLPLTSADSTIVSLGVGDDVSVEQKLIKDLDYNKVEFFGANPKGPANGNGYSKIGKLSSVAVSVNQDNQNSSGDVIHYLTQEIQRTFLDAIWMTADYSQYNMFNFINKDGQFDKNRIVICQGNMEINLDSLQKKQHFHDFLFRLLADRSYAFFCRPSYSQIQLYFVNFEDEGCVQKYLV